jgi:hypothetical protein
MTVLIRHSEQTDIAAIKALFEQSSYFMAKVNLIGAQ